MTAEPASDADADTGELLHAVARRLLSHPCHPDDHPTQMVLSHLRRLRGLAWYSLLVPDEARAGRHCWEQHLDWFRNSASWRPDTAVDIALADLRRERGKLHLALPLLARARASTSSLGEGDRAGRAADGLGPKAITC